MSFGAAAVWARNTSKKQEHCSHTRASFTVTDRQSDRQKKERQFTRSRRTQQATEICALVPGAQLGEMPPRRTSPPKTRKNISHEPIATADDAQLDKGGGRGGAGGPSLARTATVVTVRVPRFLKHPSGHTVYACCVEMPPTRQVRVSYTYDGCSILPKSHKNSDSYVRASI